MVGEGLGVGGDTAVGGDTMIYCQICGEHVDVLYRVNTEKGVRWLCRSCTARFRKLRMEAGA